MARPDYVWGRTSKEPARPNGWTHERASRRGHTRPDNAPQMPMQEPAKTTKAEVNPASTWNPFV